MSITRAHTGPVEIDLNAEVDLVDARLESLATATAQLIKASGVYDVFNYNYQPAPDDPTSPNASLVLFNTELPQYVHVSRNVDMPGGVHWIVETQLASKPVGLREKALQEYRSSVLAAITNAKFQLKDEQVEVSHLTRRLEYMPHLAGPEEATSTYPGCFKADPALRSVTLAFKRLVRRGTHMGWTPKEWSIE